jgi:hypothetical protein
MDANYKKMLAKMASFHEMIDTRNAELDAHYEKMITSQKWSTAKMDAWLAEMKDGTKETAACQETTEANPEKMEANPGEMRSVTEHEEVPKEEPTVESFGALKKWRGDRHLAVGRCEEPKEQTRGNCGSWKKLAASCRTKTRHAGVARCKGKVIRKN